MYKHSFEQRIPLPHEINYGEAVIVFIDEVPHLYTKNIFNEVIEIGKSITKFEDLEDVDLTNVSEGSYFVKEGNVYKAVNFIGSISSLNDVEVTNAVDGQYLRYDSLYQAFINATPTYSLDKITDVDVGDSSNASASSADNNKVLYYDATSSTYKLRPRTNLINELSDVEVVADNAFTGILTQDLDGVWKNMPLDISYDPAPTLGGTLNAEGNFLTNYGHAVKFISAANSIAYLLSSEADYFVVTGESNACILDFNIDTRSNTNKIILVELRQGSGELSFGGLTNVKYEDGHPVTLSGNGKTDLITVNVVNVNNVITTYITAAALNLALEGQGGVPLSTQSGTQTFAPASLYDDYYEYVLALFNFEAESITNKLWYEDKADISNLAFTTHNILQAARGAYNVGYFTNTSLSTTYTPQLSLTGTFTLEGFINFAERSWYTSLLATHILISNDVGTLRVAYTYSTLQSYLTVTIGGTQYVFDNAFRIFSYQEDRYIHFAIVRSEGDVKVYIDGHILQPLSAASVNNTVININSLSTTVYANINSLRITDGIARYVTPVFAVPNMEFGLTGGAVDILHASVFNTYLYMDEELEISFF